MKIAVIFNPVARGQKAERFRQELGLISGDCSLHPTRGPGDAQDLARRAIDAGYATIVAAGGDGTINEVINGIAHDPACLAQVRLGILPLGTVNVFAKELRIPGQFELAWKIIQTGHEMALDLPVAEYQENSEPRRRYFVQMAGAGVDSLAIDLVDWNQKKRIGQFAYWIAGFKALAARRFRIDAYANQQSSRGETILIGNGRFYGGRFPIFPLADLTDQLLDVTVISRANLHTLLRGGIGLLLNRLYQTRGIEHLKSDTVELTSPDSVRFHVEGENTGRLPARFRITDRPLRVIIPEQSGGSAV